MVHLCIHLNGTGADVVRAALRQSNLRIGGAARSYGAGQSCKGDGDGVRRGCGLRFCKKSIFILYNDDD